MPRSSRSLATNVALALLGALVVGLPLVHGGVNWAVQLAAAALAAAALVLTAGSRHETGFPLVAIALSACTLATAFQLAPLPVAMHRLVSPNAARLFDSVLGPIGLYPAARPLSLDPPATGREISSAAACALSALASARLAASSKSRGELLLVAMAFGGVAVTSLGLGAAVAGLGPLLTPRLAFVNPNHLAGFLNLTSFVALGFAMRGRGQARVLWLIAFGVAGAGVFLSLSRGGIAAFFVGVAVFALLYIRRARLDANQPGLLKYAAVPVAVSAALAVAAYLAFEPVLAEMGTLGDRSQELKTGLWPIGLRIARDFPLFGIGRGSFASAFAAYKVEPALATFTHLENEWLQAPIDLGLPLGLFLVGAVAWSWLRAARSADLSRPEIGAVAGTAALAAHSAFDFSLEVLGVAVPFAIGLGVLSRVRPGRATPPWVLRAVAATGFTLALLGMSMYRLHPTEEEAMGVALAGAADETVARARRAAAWHPADFLPQATAGARLVQEGRCAEALPWLSRAMVLNPTAPEPHRFAARCLAAGQKDDLAKREYRLALLMGDPSALQEAARHYTSLDDLFQIAPGTPAGLMALASLLATDRPADAEKVLQRAWDEFQAQGALAGLASVKLTLGRDAEALQLARELERREPATPGGYLVASRALSKLGQAEEAQRELELGAARIPGSAHFLGPLAQAALAARRFAEAHRLAESIVAHTPAEIASKRMFVAYVLHAEGRLGEAIQEARAARDVSASDPTPYLMLADLCAEVGRYDEALAAVQAAAGLPGAAPSVYEARLASLRAARQVQQDRWNRQRLLDPADRLPAQR